MAASLFRVNYINGIPDLYDVDQDGNLDADGWSFWAEEEVSSPNQPQVLMHVEHNDIALLVQMKTDTPRYKHVADLAGWPGMEETEV